MANINSKFYLALNDMIGRAAGVDDAGIIDRNSFVDYGKKLSTMSSFDEFKNAFAAEIANKTRLSIDVIRKYKGKLGFFVKGSMPAGGVLEIIQHVFMNTRAADFVSLVDGTAPDQWEINKSGQTADYFTLESAFSLCVTIQDAELEGAFASPEAMQSFLNGKITYLLNSYELATEQGRRSLLNLLVVELGAANAAANTEDAAQRYKLVTLYNTVYGLTGADALDADDALYNADFIKFAVMMINKVYKKLSIPSAQFNDGSLKVFTPDNMKRLVTIDALDNSIVAFKTTISPDATIIPDHESVEFWQKMAAPFEVSVGKTTDVAKVVVVATDADRGTDTSKIYCVAATGKYYTYANSAYTQITDFSDYEITSPKTIAVLFDDLRLGEYVTLDKTVSTPLNARSLYYNTYIHHQSKLINLASANAVIFTLE